MAAATIFLFRKMLVISARMKQFSSNFNGIYLVPASIDHLGQICNSSWDSRWRQPAILDF